MKSIIMFCDACGEYTLEAGSCPRCGARPRSPLPPRFSPEDRFGRYRRAMKKEWASTGGGPSND